MEKDQDFTEAFLEKLNRFRAYAQTITSRAGEAFLVLRPAPEGDTEIALQEAYEKGLAYAGSLELGELESEVKTWGISICEELGARRSFFSALGGDLSPEEFINSTYRDDRVLADFWEQSPEIAENTAFWHGINDVHHFAICFQTKAIFQDDYRRIRKTVETALEQVDILDIWQAATHMAYADYTPPAPNGRGMSQDFLSNLDL